MIDFKILSDSLEKAKCDLLVIGHYEGENKLTGVAATVDRGLKGLITSLINTKEITGKPGTFTVVHNQGKLPAKRIAIVGLGKKQECTPIQVKRAGAAATAAANQSKAKTVVSTLIGTEGTKIEPREAAEAIVIGVLLGDYRYLEQKSAPAEDELSSLRSFILLEPSKANKAKIEALKEAANRGKLIGQAVREARNLINGPANVITPTYLAKYAEGLAKEADLHCTVWDLKDIQEKKMGAFYGVAKGSHEPAKMVILKYRGKTKESIGLIGKGVTFDSGGISLKPSRKMEEMKMDMSGAAAVLETMRVIGKLKPKQSVIAVIPITENMPGGSAQKPGDVVTALNGKTIEVINTDAEGRLILADALAYARKLGVTKMIDIATLTGAVVVALGDEYAAVLGNDQAWIDEIKKAGEAVDEKFWQLPLTDKYSEMLKSKVADLKNVSDTGKAGTITGAAFLKAFAEETPWAHLDIAGTAWNDNGQAFGMGVQTFIKLICT